MASASNNTVTNATTYPKIAPNNPSKIGVRTMPPSGKMAPTMHAPMKAASAGISANSAT